MSELLIVLGVIVFSFALRSFRARLLRKLGALGLLAATFLAFYLPTGSIAAGVGGLLIWFLLPWLELLTRVRNLRLPIHKSLEQQAPPGASRFPAFSEMTDEVEKEGFEYVTDTGWEWDGVKQFFRLFYNAETREQAAICLTEQDDISWGCPLSDDPAGKRNYLPDDKRSLQHPDGFGSRCHRAPRARGRTFSRRSREASGLDERSGTRNRRLRGGDT
jgi:hypothetical protein